MKILLSLLLLISTAALSAAAQASASTGGNQTICGSQSTTGLGGSVGSGATTGLWTSSGTGTFAPDDTTLNATYTRSAADASTGTVTLTLTTTDQPEGVEPGTAQVVVTLPPVLQAPVAWDSDPTNMVDMGVYLCWSAVPGADGYCVDIFDAGLYLAPYDFTATIINLDVGSTTNFLYFDAVPGQTWNAFRVRAYTTNTCDAKRHYGPSSEFAAAYNSIVPTGSSLSATDFESVQITWDGFTNDGTSVTNETDYLTNFLAIANLATVTRISLSNQGITSISLLGSDFPVLQSVDLSGNLLTNVYCGNWAGSLTHLNVADNPYLLSVDCFAKYLVELDVTNDTNLQRLNAFNNQGLANIDISTCTSLTFVDLDWCQLASIDISRNTNLTSLFVADNPLVSLDVTNNTELLVLNAGSELITSLDLSNNPKLQILHLICPNLTNLSISGTELVSLDLSSCPAGVMPTLTNMPNLMQLVLPPGMPNLDISHNPLLFWLNCSSNSLPSLAPSNYPLLEELWCAGCNLTSLDISGNPKLIYLDCSSNSLPSLDVSQNLSLRRLICAGCGLTDLDISGHTNLTYLDCYNNSLQCSSVGNILSYLYGNGQAFGRLNLSGGSNCPPTNGYQNYYVENLMNWDPWAGEGPGFWNVIINLP